MGYFAYVFMYSLFIGHIYPASWVYMPTMVNIYAYHAGYIYNKL